MWGSVQLKPHYLKGRPRSITIDLGSWGIPLDSSASVPIGSVAHRGRNTPVTRRTIPPGPWSTWCRGAARQSETCQHIHREICPAPKISEPFANSLRGENLDKVVVRVGLGVGILRPSTSSSSCSVCNHNRLSGDSVETCPRGPDR